MAYFAMLLAICEKTAWDIEITSMDSYKESTYELSNDTKICPQLKTQASK